MFSFCRGIHTNPKYQWFGTIDCAVLNNQTGVLMFFSVIMNGPLYEGLVFHPPFPANLVLKDKPPTTANLRALFEMVKNHSEATVDVACYDELDQEELLKLVVNELQPVPQKTRDPLVAAITKLFSGQKK